MPKDAALMALTLLARAQVPVRRTATVEFDTPWGRFKIHVDETVPAGELTLTQAVDKTVRTGQTTLVRHSTEFALRRATKRAPRKARP